LLFANLEKIKKIKALLTGELEFEMLDVLNQMNQAKSAITDLHARSSCSLWRSRYQLLKGQVMRDQQHATLTELERGGIWSKTTADLHRCGGDFFFIW
jgi:hypothetical protein